MAAKKLTKAEAFYVESHFGLKEPKDIAADLGLKVAQVKAYIAKLEEAGVKPAKPKKSRSKPDQAGFAVHEPEVGGEPSASISVSMTRQASETGDELRKLPASGRFRGKVRDSLHVIDPSRPVL